MRRRDGPVVAGAAAIAAVGVLVARLRRDRARLRRGAAAQHVEWARVPAPPDGRALRLRVRVGGVPTGAPPVVLVHGYAIGADYFIPLLEVLGRDHHVLAPELPGHGASERPARPLAIREQADVLARWLVTRAPEGATLVGQSMGCQIAVELALRHPALVRSLALVAPTVDPGARHPLAQIVRLVRCAVHERPSMDVLAVLEFLRAGPRLLLAELAAALRHDMAGGLQALGARGVPALVLRGRADRLVPGGWAARAAALTGGPPAVEVGGAGHAVHYSRPGRVAALLHAWSAHGGGIGPGGASRHVHCR